MTILGIAQILIYFVIVVAITKPVGIFLYRVFEGADHVFANHAEAVAEAVEDHCGKAIARRAMALAAD